VPVLRNVENMNYADIEKGLNELGEKVCMIHMFVTFISILHCGRRVGNNSIQCTSCQKWIHRKCSGMKGSM